MTKKETKIEEKQTSDVIIDVELRGERSVAPRAVWFWNLLNEIMDFVPSHRESRQGRKSARNIRISMLAAGILILALGGQESGIWVVVGIALGASSLAFPVAELKKRSWRTKIEKRRRPGTEAVWLPGKIIYDGRRVELHDEEKKVRHVLVHRDEHELVVRENEENLCLGILSPKKRKKENIWVCASGPVEVEVEPKSEVGVSEMDRPARVDPEGWRALWDVLGGGDI